MTCILISTFDRCEKMARWTEERIVREWASHPPVFFAGLSRRDEQSPGFDGDSKDWMNVNRQAVVWLREKGFTHAYLVLDDHPPVGCCEADFLNSQLPELAVRLDAACIGLLGYGQHRPPEGRALGPEDYYTEHTSTGYRWKFSLHPGLWSLKDLQTLLDCRMAIYSGRNRTPWNFERHRDVPGDSRVDEIAGRCFRIHGASCLASGSTGRRAMRFEAMRRFLADIGLFAAKTFGGKSRRAALELRWLWAFGHYAGPYPVFWSGCMRQGMPHADFEKWLASSGPEDLVSSWNAAKADF
ncbi:MAG: hypothetical protein D4R65_11275 [Verrucomicrobiaceae bacterium]|nr:MAG: hypothetical protein D4R65_11275 [Verrucomicrobiaceae bacterium]